MAGGGDGESPMPVVSRPCPWLRAPHSSGGSSGLLNCEIGRPVTALGAVEQRPYFTAGRRPCGAERGRRAQWAGAAGPPPSLRGPQASLAERACLLIKARRGGGRTGKRRKTLSGNSHQDKYLMENLLSAEFQVLCCALFMNFFI